MQGKIIKGIAGFYYVHVTGKGIYECKAKGIFRKDNKKPLVGDDVCLEVLDEKAKLGNLEQILPRHNSLVRPAVANISQALIIFAMKRPSPNFNLLDRFLIMMERQKIPCIICFNKEDISSEQEKEDLKAAYGKCGCGLLFTSAEEEKGIAEIQAVLAGKTTSVAGPSGVGKSSLVNCLQQDVCMETGVLSERIERGKNTTRHTQLIAIGADTYIMDTPGFSSFHLAEIEKEELKHYYPEFSEYESTCKFQSCVHINEPVCGVKEALRAGKVSRIRYDNYRTLYTELNEKRRY